MARGRPRPTRAVSSSIERPRRRTPARHRAKGRSGSTPSRAASCALFPSVGCASSARWYATSERSPRTTSPAGRAGAGRPPAARSARRARGGRAPAPRPRSARPLEELERGRHAADERRHLARRRPPAVRPARTRATSPPRAARSRRRRSRRGRPCAQSRRSCLPATTVAEPLPFPRLGVWRSLVARSVRVGEVPSSNLGTPIGGGGTAGFPHVPSRRRHDASSLGSAVRRCGRRMLDSCCGPCSSTSTSPSRGPGPSSGPEATGASASSTASTSTRPLRATRALAALDDLQRHPELVHDEEIWIAFTEDIVRGMGGDARARARARSTWCGAGSDHDELRALRRRAARARRAAPPRAARSGSSRTASATWRSSPPTTGSTSTSPSARRRTGGPSRTPRSSRRALGALGVEPAEAAMVGDSYEDDIEGARALGMRAILLDRDGRPPRRARPDRRPRRPPGGPRPRSAVAPPQRRDATPRCGRRAGASPPLARRGPPRSARRLRQGRDRADADVLAVEERRATRRAACGANTAASSSASASWARRTGARASSGRPTSSHSRTKNFGSSAATVSRRPSAVA